MKSVQKGVTLIELMIVVAIIGILAAIAIPQYQNYIAKSQVSRVMSEAGSLKTVVENCINEGRTANFITNVAAGAAVAATDCELGATASTLLAGAGQTPAVAATAGTNGYPNVTFPATGAEIEAIFGSGAANTLATKTLTWSRSPEGTWTCATTVDSKFRPTGCA